MPRDRGVCLFEKRFLARAEYADREHVRLPESWLSTPSPQQTWKMKAILSDTTHLAHLLTRAETSPGYLSELKEWTRSLAPLIDPAREQQAWSDLIEELHLLKP